MGATWTHFPFALFVLVELEADVRARGLDQR
jgi:hypothetical protein